MKKIIKEKNYEPIIKKYVRKKRIILISSLLLIFLGLSALAYIFGGGLISSIEQKNAISTYAEVTSDYPNKEEVLKNALEYNKYVGNIPLGDPYRNNSETSLEYLNNLSFPNTDVMSRITIPRINVDLPVYHGTSEEVFLKGAGHVYGTSLPIGGINTHTAISAHTGAATSNFFNDLPKLEIGDIFIITTMDDKYVYQVDNIEVVLPHESEKLRVQEGRDLATLVTCTPYGINTHRLLVTGHRIPYDPENLEHTVPEIPNVDFPFWLLLVGLGFIVTTSFGIWQYKSIDKNIRKKVNENEEK